MSHRCLCWLSHQALRVSGLRHWKCDPVTNPNIKMLRRGTWLGRQGNHKSRLLWNLLVLLLIRIFPCQHVDTTCRSVSITCRYILNCQFIQDGHWEYQTHGVFCQISMTYKLLIESRYSHKLAIYKHSTLLYHIIKSLCDTFYFKTSIVQFSLTVYCPFPLYAQGGAGNSTWNSQPLLHDRVKWT